ncbi:chemoreceptor glutamine deamidase CheD [Zoogloea sp.]|uniref:chemoreceptor glutamine deamidase CheD n=1 Tax=Zoogloea sp. TaxID=49181 RepID=UPI001A3958C0|nr:chemoreceptor glutamine deamidase CheD [Zoogloea sp.]MBL8435713.1 chemoreceptor glutamine deamidase CheD [Zoogloea sp.]MCK6370616.1 chemoreceptor glutamine deamidase CheD [Gammaproteobacteria bacterium]MDD3328593.1 chemoreceptor glutamine deamidase CheD [Zoogloea sp.]
MSVEPGYLEHLATNRYFDRTFDCDAVKVLPGEYFVTTSDILLVTVLGSCVTACIRDRDKGLGGMNHFMLPDASEGGMLSSSARYGAYAMEVLLNHLLKLGARRTSLEAKVFGGGQVLASLTQTQVGEKNAQFVLDYLHTERIPIVAQDLLDIYPRKVYFFPANGRVMMKKLVRVKNDTLIEREREYQARLRRDNVQGDIELFG